MSSAFCSLDDAFAGPILPPKKKKTRGSGREPPVGVETFVPAALPGTAQEAGDPDRQVAAPPAAELLKSPSGATGKLDSAAALQEFFPLPGASAEQEEWQKAFMLEPSTLPRPDGSVAVAGRSTLWRQIPAPPAPAPSPDSSPTSFSAIPTDISQRLDVLTRQLENLSAPTPMQSTAELFLFVAIGLLLLLAIDTLLRFASSVVAGQRTRALVGGMRRSARFR
jgi:hypothetical protein